MAAPIVLDRVYPIRDAAMWELFEEIDELRALIAKRKRMSIGLHRVTNLRTAGNSNAKIPERCKR